MNIIDDPLCRLVSEQLSIPFSVPTNTDLSPGQLVATIISDKSGYQQQDSVWGIKPDWAKRLIIKIFVAVLFYLFKLATP